MQVHLSASLEAVETPHAVNGSLAAHHRKTFADRDSAPLAALLASRVARAGQIFKREADGCAPSAQHAADNLDNRHVEIVCATSARVNVSVLYQFVDTANRPWPTGVAPRRISFGRAARGSVAPRKMACRPAAGGRMRRFKAINSRTEEGAAWSLPLSNREREWTPTYAASVCSPPCRCSAQASPGLGIAVFLPRSFWRSV